jgi:hypothetical protein
MTSARIARMRPFTIIDFSTHIVEKNTSDVTTLPMNDPIVEKNKSFPMITAFRSSSISSERSGIV